MATFFIFGSSIPYGLKDYENGGWAARLGLLIARNYPKDERGKDNLLYNLSISGGTTTGLAKRFRQEAEARVREGVENVFIFSIGGNDAAFIKEVGVQVTPLEVFVANYRSFLDEAKAFNGKILITSLTPVVDEWAGEASGKPRIKSNGYQRSYAEAVRALADEYGATFIDMAAPFGGRDAKELISGDGVHPNAEGHALMFEAAKAVIEPLLAR